MPQLLGKKLGMTKIFDETGRAIVCTVIKVDPNIVIRTKTQDKDGYTAVEASAFSMTDKEKKRMAKPQLGHFKKCKIEPMKRIFEFPLGDGEQYEDGQVLSVELFKDEKYVDVIGVTQGKGFQGVMKRHGFRGGPAAHGSGFHRTAGSTGMCSDPARVFKGHKMAGHMGDVRQTTECLKVINADKEMGVLLVQGAVPGREGSEVRIRKSVKKQGKK